MTIGTACAQLDVSPRTLRYYEELGFLQPERTAGGHRLYGEVEIELVRRIVRMQAMGFSLRAIRRALRYRSYRDESGKPRMPLGDLRALVAEARADAIALHARIASLQNELELAQRDADEFDRDCALLEAALATREAEGTARGARR